MTLTIILPLQAADLPAVGQLFAQYRQFYEQAPDLARAQRFMAQRFERGESVVQRGQVLPFACESKNRVPCLTLRT